MRVKVYKKLGVLVALLFSIWGVGFALNSVLTGILPIFPLTLEEFSLSPPSKTSPVSNEPPQDTLVQRENARILNPTDIVIPIREGFPFCETFIGFDLRDNIELGGNAAADVELTGNSLQLTGISNDESGYMFVDIPFSSLFGLKVSFEFSHYGGSGADGISFFMFDGSISAADFLIGGTGGALGYTSVRATANEATLISPGLKGAYLGIGFDELGNFGNSRTGKYGGFEDPTNADVLLNTPLFPHSVVVRGPVDGPPPTALGTPFRDWDRVNSNKFIPGTIGNPRFQSYKFIDGRIFDPASTGIASTNPPVSVAQYLHPEKFEIDTDSFSGSCLDEGFRKVFLDLNPVDVNDPTQGYTIEIQMLVNVGNVIKLVNVFNGPINYPFAAPELLKVGFAASTGLQTNYHQIRNVTVQVSNVNALEKPLIEPLNEEVCEGESNTFDLDVELRNDAANAFIRCLQLYETEAEAFAVVAASSTSIPFPPAGNVNSLCPTGNCIDILCRPERTSRPAFDDVTGEPAGQFQVLLLEEGGLEVPKVRFIPQPGYSGVTTMYYTATDNFGQVSDPKPITITINPLPDPIITTVDPLIWEQVETANIKVRFEAQPKTPGFSYQWLKDNLPIAGATSDFFVATTAGDYSVEITTDKGCVALSAQEVTIRIVANLSPSFGNTQNPETCGALGNISVTLADFSVTGIKADGTPGNEKWRIVNLAGNVIFDWTFMSPGQKTILRDLLPAGNYLFQIGDEFRGGQLGSDGNPLFRHVIPFTIGPINPPLSIVSVLETPELCFGAGGSFNVVASGGAGNGTYVFQITNTVTGVVRTEAPTGNSFTFTAVPQGDYSLKVTSLTRCQETRIFKIAGPAAALSTQFLSSNQISCGLLTSGSISWQAVGGTPDYTFVRLERNGSPVAIGPVQTAGKFNFSGLVSGSYKLVIKDKNSCEFKSDPVILQDIPKPAFLVNDDGVCGNETALLIPEIVTLSNSVPVFSWIVPNGTEINSNTILNGITYTVLDHDGNSATPSSLQISGLTPGVYLYKLKISGTNSCDQLVDSKVTVTPIPEIKIIKQTDPLCFGGNDGFIEVGVSNGDLKDFEFSIDGIYPYQPDNKFSGKLPAGTYTIRVRNLGSGCENDLKVTITGPAAALSTQVLESNQIRCGNLTSGFISWSVSGGTPAYTFVRLERNGTPVAITPVQTAGKFDFSGLVSGTYELVVKDSNSCEIKSASVILQEVPKPVFDVNDDGVCANESALLIPEIITLSNSIPIFSWITPSGTEINSNTTLNGITYTILDHDGNSATPSALQISGLTPGVYLYKLKISGANSCDQLVDSKVTVTPIPELKIIKQTDPLCFGGNDGFIEVGVSNGDLKDFEFSIDGIYPYQLDNKFSGKLPAGTYTIRVANSVTGCEAEFSVTVGEPDVLLIEQDVVINSSCEEENGSIEFVLKGGTPKADGTYEILINGLPLSDFTQTVTVSGAGENLVKISDLAEGPYVVVIKDLNNCEVTQTFTLTAQILPEYTLADLEICLNETAEIIPVIVNAGTPVANPVFHWYKDSLATQEILDGADAGLQLTFDVDSGSGRLFISNFTNAATYTFYLKPEIVNSCDFTPIPVTVTVFALPDVTFEVIGVACFGESNGEIKLVTGGDPSYTFTLNTGVKNNTGNFTGLPAGTYQVTIANAEGCEVMEVMVIEQPAQLQIQKIEQTDPTCGDSNGEIVFEISGGTPAYKILINGDSLSNYKSLINGNRYTIQDLAPGVYSIAVGDANTCSIASNNLFTLVNNEGVNINSQPIFVEICESGTAQLVPQVTIPPGTNPIFRWYYDSTATKEIIHNPSPAADGKIYQISGTSVLSIQNLTPGSYKYYLRITGPSICTQITEATVTVTDPVVASVEAESITCFGDANGQITVKDFAGGNGTYEFSINGTDWQASPVFPNLAANTYPVSIRDSSGSNGCVLVIDTVVEGPSGPISDNTPDIIRASCGLDNGAVRNLQISGGWGNYTFEWRKGNATTGQLLPQGTLTGIEDLAAGVYYLTISDDQGCKATFNYTIGESSDPVYQVVPPVNSCFGTPIIIRPIHLAPNPSLPPAAATEVRWYKDPNQAGLISNGPDAVTPSVIYSIDDTNWINPELNIKNLPVGTHDFYFYVVCTGQEIKIDVTVFETPEMVFEAIPVTCFGDTNGKIKAVSGQSPSYLYQLNGGNNLTLSQLEALNLTTGSYTLSVVTPAGCPQTLQLEITSPSAPLQLQNLSKIDQGCGASNGKINGQIQGGWAPYTIQIIKNGSPANQITVPGPTLAIDGLSVGAYSLVVTDSRGCVVSSATLNLVDGPTQILVQDQTICAGELVTFTPQLDPQVPVATYTWSFDLAGSNVITSSQTPAPDGRTYQISPAGVLTIKGLPSSSQPYQFYVKVDGSGVCPGFIAAPKVLVTDSPSATVNVVNAVCFGDGGSLTVNASGGDGTYTFSLDGVNFQTSNVFQVPAGLYDLTVKSGAACLFELPAIQVQGPSAALTFNELKAINSTCNLDNGEISFNIKGGYGNYQVRTFKNNTSIGVSAADANGNFVVNDLGIGVYSFEVIDSSGCTLKLSNALNLIEEPSQITVNDAVICEGETGILKPAVNSNSPDLSFTWYSDAEGKNPISSGTSADVTYTLDANGQLSVAGLAPRTNPYTYYVLAAGVGICGVAPVPATIKVGALPQLRVSNPSIVCDPNGTVDLTEFIEGFNSNVYDYQILSPNGSPMRLDQIETVNQSGSYQVQSSIKGASCWSPNQRIQVIISDTELIPEFNYEIDLGGGNVLANAEIQIQEPVQFQDVSLGKIIIWNWDFGDGSGSSEQNPTHEYEKKGIYTITLTTIDEFGCVDIFERVAQVFDDYVIIVPNAFTPTGLKNQYFKPKYRGISSMEFYIFNTWGELIFEANSLETLGWDGTLNGQNTPNGNYVYRGVFMTRSGEKVEKSGVFILIR